MNTTKKGSPARSGTNSPISRGTRRKSALWWDESWNPVTGCSAVSEGCAHCYAKAMHDRFYQATKFEHVVLHPERLDRIEHAKPKVWFVDSMSDLFHEDVPFTFIQKVFNVMWANPLHTFVILTKRPSQMLAYFAPGSGAPENLWLGVSAENQERADERIPLLLAAPVAHRFVCVGPMLGPVNLELVVKVEHGAYSYNALTGEEWPFTEGPVIGAKIEGIICEGESGPLGRVMHPDWVRALRDQCVEAEVPFFFKQWGAWHPDDLDGVMVRSGRHTERMLDGREWNELPWGKKPIAPVTNQVAQLKLEVK